MDLHEIIKTHNVDLATIYQHPDWVKAKAVDLDLEKELHIAELLSQIFMFIREKNKFAGISSNNVFWNITQTPVRVMCIPNKHKEYITLINPKYIALEGAEFNSVESCGSIQKDNYKVLRKPFVAVGGYSLTREHIEVELGSRNHNYGNDSIIGMYYKEWVIQHEMDHLDGITIKDKGEVFDLNELMY